MSLPPLFENHEFPEFEKIVRRGLVVLWYNAVFSQSHYPPGQTSCYIQNDIKLK